MNLRFQVVEVRLVDVHGDHQRPAGAQALFASKNQRLELGAAGDRHELVDARAGTASALVGLGLCEQLDFSQTTIRSVDSCFSKISV